MKRQAFNPYLPSYEYVPDAEPHLFDGRVYVYGSHDRFNGISFCLNDYVCWSAPEDDLSDWRYEGVIYKKGQDGENYFSFISSLFAPDVCRGSDGRYYLYYSIGYSGIVSVAVCGSPAGRYEFLGFVRYADGERLGSRGEPLQFDPGVFRDDDGRTYLYTGFGPDRATPFMIGKRPAKGAMCFELCDDMLTIRRGPMDIGVPAHSASHGTPYEGHAFFEASSVRKFGRTYYFIYSSYLGHELCYATADSPLGPFTYGGTLVSIGDIGLGDCADPATADNFTGNTHGSVIEIGGEYYVFYHRQTNRHQFSRQACAERLTMRPDGGFDQVPVTSCGLNGGPLKGTGTYRARIACILRGPEGDRFYGITKGHRTDEPFFTQSGEDRETMPDQYIANMRDGAAAGFRYFDFHCPSFISVTVSGPGGGRLDVSADGEEMASVPLPECRNTRETRDVKAHMKGVTGVKTLVFTYRGEGYVNFHEFTIG